MSSFFKQNPLSRDNDYLSWVREQPSVISGNGPCIAHHIIGHGRLSNLKTSDYWAIPLTDSEHKELHQHGWKQWEEQYGFQHRFALETLTRAIDGGFFHGK